jgi:hypothetical protein
MLQNTGVGNVARLFIVLLSVSWMSTVLSAPKKIVGLMQIRNEASVIEQAVHALSLYTDAIVVLDDASHDGTVDVCQNIASKYRIESIVCNQQSAWEHGKESDNRQKLLDAGRAIGGTHFIVIDADEVLTSNCSKNNFLKNLILTLNPGDRIFMSIMHCWGSLDRYRTYFNEQMKCFIFCDDGVCVYVPQFLHINRSPLTLKGGVNFELANPRYGLLHLGYLNWPSVEIRQVWYKCLERVRNPQKSIQEINSWYNACKEKYFDTQEVPREWLSEYVFFDPSLYAHEGRWRMEQIERWVDQFGLSYFAGLDGVQELIG